MVKAILGITLLAATFAAGAAALAQNAPPPASSAAPPASAQPAPAAAAPSAAGPITALQQALKEQGYAPGPVNGVMTEKTRQALAAYERRAGRRPQALAAGPGGAMSDPVRRAQAALQRLGLLAGPADGVVGPATRDAIIRFEATRHLTIDPRVSDTLLAALDEAGAGVAPQAAAPQPAASPTPSEGPPEASGRRPLPPGVNPPPIR